MGVAKNRNLLYNLRSDDFAGSAPGREGIEDNDLVILEGGLEFSLAVAGKKKLVLAIDHQDIKPCPAQSISQTDNVRAEALGSRKTYLLRLWTPILTVVLWKPRLRMVLLMLMILAEEDDDRSALFAVRAVDRARNDIQEDVIGLLYRETR